MSPTQHGRGSGGDGGAPDDMTDRISTPVDERSAAQRKPEEDHLGAVEGDRPTDQPNQGNANAPALDENGLPNDPIAICEDVIGANVDGSEGG
jgi:hypothetical protein